MTTATYRGHPLTAWDREARRVDGERFRREREKRGLSVGEWARAHGVAVDRVKVFERGGIDGETA